MEAGKREEGEPECLSRAEWAGGALDGMRDRIILEPLQTAAGVCKVKR